MCVCILPLPSVALSHIYNIIRALYPLFGRILKARGNVYVYKSYPLFLNFSGSFWEIPHISGDWFKKHLFSGFSLYWNIFPKQTSKKNHFPREMGMRMRLCPPPLPQWKKWVGHWSTSRGPHGSRSGHLPTGNNNPHQIKIKPSYCPPGPQSLGLLPTTTIPNQTNISTGKITHQNQYLSVGNIVLVGSCPDTAPHDSATTVGYGYPTLWQLRVYMAITGSVWLLRGLRGAYWKVATYTR